MKKYISLVNNELVIPFQVGFQAISFRHPIRTFAKIYRHFAGDSLYRNSIYLMLSTAIMAFFGFFFWIINARLYTPEQVGIATTLISVMGLIAGFSNLGLNVGLVRFLPSSKNKNELINSSFLISSVTALVLSVIFLLGLHIFSPKLLFLRENLIYSISFVLFVVALANNTIVEALFVAYRSAKYTLIKNSVLSLTKLFLPVAFIAFSAYGIFVAVGLANIIALALAVFILIKLFNFRIAYKHNFDEVKRISAYSFGNYVAGFLGGLPTMLLPLIIVNKIGAAEAGYFYIALMIANFLFIIPQATTQSLFAEGSYREDEMREHVKKSIKITSLLLFPTIILIMLFGNYILLAFGKKYSTEAFILLQLFAISSIFTSISIIINTILRVRNRLNELIFITAFSAFINISLSYLFIGLKLRGIGIAWLISQTIILFVYIIFMNKIFINKIFIIFFERKIFIQRFLTTKYFLIISYLRGNKNIRINNNVFLSNNSQILSDVSIGYATGISGKIIIKGTAKVEIGKYCSIGSDVKIITSNHKTNTVNTQITMAQKYFKQELQDKTKGDTIIGSNVWIGDSVIILPGVRVGDGAVIGAASIVTKSILPYAIYVGNPAKLIKYRFSEKVIMQLLDIQWWNWSEEKIKINKDFFMLDLEKNPDVNLSKIIK